MLVWQFVVDVTDEHIQQAFTAHTDMTWGDFAREAYQHFDKPRDEVELGYRIHRDARGLIQLLCEYDWRTALMHVRERAKTARVHAVSMELRNTKKVSVILIEIENN